MLPAFGKTRAFPVTGATLPTQLKRSDQLFVTPPPSQVAGARRISRASRLGRTDGRAVPRERRVADWDLRCSNERNHERAMSILQDRVPVRDKTATKVPPARRPDARRT